MDEIPKWLEWTGLIVTIGSGIISAFVLIQTTQLKNAFFLKAKLPKLHKKISNYRLSFNQLLEKDPNNFKKMCVIQAQVKSVLDQAIPSLSKIDSAKVKQKTVILSSPITNEYSAWKFYEELSALESHIGESSEDLRWNS